MGKVQGKVYKRGNDTGSIKRMEGLEKHGIKKTPQLRRKNKLRKLWKHCLKPKTMALLPPMAFASSVLGWEDTDLLCRPSQEGSFRTVSGTVGGTMLERRTD